MKIEKLFGKFDYDLNFDNEDGVTILTGPNGFGKTTILGFIDRISRRNFTNFTRWQYDNISFDFDNGKTINLKDKIQNNYSNRDEFKNLFGNIVYLTDQRLYYVQEAYLAEEIIKLPFSLISEISEASREHTSVSSKLESTFSKRLHESTEGISEEQYKKRLKSTENKFKKLNEYNLTNISFDSEAYYDKRNELTLKIHLDDFDDKYKVFEKLIIKLDLFTSIINSCLIFKKIKISPVKGFYIENENGDLLELDWLSSGEKQEIILFFNLIFNTTESTLLLIDEPEMSLHVTWQHRFIEDLISIAKVNGFKAIVATHSPQIINGRWDLQIDLGEIYNEKNKTTEK
jgi:predicted ATP-binding protein involved in virulence